MVGALSAFSSHIQSTPSVLTRQSRASLTATIRPSDICWFTRCLVKPVWFYRKSKFLVIAFSRRRPKLRGLYDFIHGWGKFGDNYFECWRIASKRICAVFRSHSFRRDGIGFRGIVCNILKEQSWDHRFDAIITSFIILIYYCSQSLSTTDREVMAWAPPCFIDAKSSVWERVRGICAQIVFFGQFFEKYLIFTFFVTNVFFRVTDALPPPSPAIKSHP